MSIRNIKERLKRKLTPQASFKRLEKQDHVYLYPGDVPQNGLYDKYVGLSLNRHDEQHIIHDIRKRLPLSDNTVDIYQSEDVFEHIQPEKLPFIINEAYRVLKPGGIFRLSMPDYGCDILYDRAIKNEDGKIIFDPGGGGELVDGKVIDGGHLWFPTYEKVKAILQQTHFTKIKFLHYYNEEGKGITKQIDYSIGYVKRTPDHDDRVQDPYRPMSIVVDCTKD
jgi:SAM-dependent methyltransferase